MKLLSDIHTHTVYSHGTGTIEDNVKSAIKKGLKQIAITDHGLKHLAFGISIKKLIKMRKEINELKKKYPEIEILLGVEANIISHDGDIDVSEEAKQYLDVVIVGFHKAGKAKNIKAFFKFVLPNCLNIKTKKQVEINTNAYLKMLEKYNYITCITHLKYACAVDAVKIAKQCKMNNVYVELNGKRTLFTEQELNEMIENKVKFLINSDAHSARKVGNVTHPMNVAIQNQIPRTLIDNINKLPNIKREEIKEK